MYAFQKTAIHPTFRLRTRERLDAVHYKVKKGLFFLLPLCVHHIFLSFSFPLGICSFASTPRVEIKKLFQKAAFFFLSLLQAKQFQSFT